jgi:MFS family permease
VNKPPAVADSLSALAASRRGAFAILFAVSMIMAAGNTALQSVIPAIGRELHIADPLIASVFSLSAVAWTLTSSGWARASDRHGRKRLVLLGLVGFSVSMLVFALGVWLGLRGWFGPMAAFGVMLVARSLFGFIGSAATPAAQAYIADRTDRSDRTQALATFASALGLGTVLGPALAPFLVVPGLGLAGPMAIFALIGFVVLVAVMRALPSGDTPQGPRGERPTRAERPDKGLWRDPAIVPFVAYGFVFASAQAINVTILGFQVIDRLHVQPREAQSFIGIAMLAGAVATLLAQWGLIRMLRMTPAALLRWGALCAAAGNLLLILAPSYYGVVVGYAVASLGYGFGRPGFTAGASLAVGPERQGAVAGIMAALSGACYILAPVTGVWLYQHFGPTPFVINLVLLSGLLVAAFRVPRLARAGSTEAASEAAPEASSRTSPPPP